MAEDNGNVVQSAEQVWTLTNLGDGIYTVQAKDGRTLTVEDGSKENGANISLKDYINDDSQKFILRLNDDNTYTLLTVTSGGTHCADVYNISLDDGANICQWEFWGGVGQKFTIEPFAEVTETTTTTTITEVTTTTEDTTPKETVQESEQEVQPQLKTGDINFDGKVDSLDAFILKKYILDMDTLTEKQFNVADISEDGSVNIIDMIALKSIIEY